MLHRMALAEAYHAHGCSHTEAWWRHMAPVGQEHQNAQDNDGALQKEQRLLDEIEACRPWPDGSMSKAEASAS